MRILVTRPEPDTTRLAEVLRRKGHEPIIAPLMTIAATDELPPAGVESGVLLFTSANGVRAAAARDLKPGCGVFVVGPATAAAAGEAGFAVKAVAEGDAKALAQLIKNHLSTDQLLVHVAGADVAGDLKGDLEAAGFTVKRWVAYRAEAAKVLPDAARRFLAGRPGGVLLFSPRTAKLLASLIADAGLSEAARAHSALCLSAAVGEAAAGLPWREIRIAARPEQSALLDLLD